MSLGILIADRISSEEARPRANRALMSARCAAARTAALLDLIDVGILSDAFRLRIMIVVLVAGTKEIHETPLGFSP